jgi:hypothetical protein
MDSSAFAGCDKYCHNGGIAFAHHHGAAGSGSKNGDHGPFLRFFRGEKYCRNGSVGLADSAARLIARKRCCRVPSSA